MVQLCIIDTMRNTVDSILQQHAKVITTGSSHNTFVVLMLFS